jgi:hypothetical protein
MKPSLSIQTRMSRKLTDFSVNEYSKVNLIVG